MVNYESILEGSLKYHNSKGGKSYNLTYDRFFKFRAPLIHNSKDPIGLAEAESLKSFANSWKGHCKIEPEDLQEAISSKWALILNFRNYDLLSSNLSIIQNQIEDVFNSVASSSKQFESTNASKFLHLIQPELFVMWDDSIRKEYGMGRYGKDYAYHFLPYMQEIIHEAVEQVIKSKKCSKECAVGFICACGHKLTKVIDEYNFTRLKMG